MIKKLYVDNYKGLVNFSLDFDGIQLWLGKNGTGKSSVLEILHNIQLILTGNDVKNVFSYRQRTRWMKKKEIEINFQIEINNDAYIYTLILAEDQREKHMRIKKEELKWKDQIFYSFEDGYAVLYRINRQTKKVEKGAEFHADWKRSFIINLSPRDDNYPIENFTSHVSGWLILKPLPIPSLYTYEEDSNLEKDTGNFPGWYRFIIQGQPSVYNDMVEALQESIENFHQLKLTSVGEGRRLDVVLDKGSHTYGFDEISDGQRILIIMYAVIFALKNNIFQTLFLDEPDNFITLSEIRPLIGEMREICETQDKQIVIISHHPEVINELGYGDELWFSRKDGSHVITTREPKAGNPQFSPAEIFANGWN